MISANTLFHYTSSFETLLAILKENQFRPSFCIDNYKELLPKETKEEFQNYAIPMVCFCDIPLSQIKEHIKEYGDYAIGLDKQKWAIENKLNPVLYLTNCEKLTTAFLNLTDKFLRTVTEDSEQEVKNIVKLIQHIKPYSGNRWVKNDLDFEIAITEFYTEREWRYSPDKTEDCIIPYADFVNTKKKQEIQDKLKDCCSLPFCAKDIKYIIVKEEKQVSKLIEFILNELTFKKEGCNDEMKKLLCSKILTIKQITEDF